MESSINDLDLAFLIPLERSLFDNLWVLGFVFEGSRVPVSDRNLSACISSHAKASFFLLARKSNESPVSRATGEADLSSSLPQSSNGGKSRM